MVKHNRKAESVVAIIPARGGSKGLKSKNILDLGGKPLIAWTIEAAKNCKLIERVLVSTDDKTIAEISSQYGADVPFLRPADLSDDTASSEDVLLHALKWLEKEEGKVYSIWVYLQPTDIFRRDNIISKVVERLMGNPDLDTVFAAYPEHKNYWRKTADSFQCIDQRGHTPRQAKEHLYREDTGIACATKENVIRQGKRIGEHVDIIPHISGFDFIDIHSEFDLWLANKIISEKGELPY